MQAGRATAGVRFQLLLLALLALAGCSPQDAPADLPDSLPLVDIQPIEAVSLNRLPLASPEKDTYQFLAAGHIYGNSSTPVEHPASTLMNALPQFADIDAMLLLGDMNRISTTESLDALAASFLNAAPYPILNAAGNHDDTAAYRSRFGPTSYVTQVGSTQIIVLDTTLGTCSIRGDQRDMLAAALAQAVADDTITRVFVLGHHVMFSNDLLLRIFSSGMAKANWPGFCDNSNYLELYRLLFRPAALQKPVYLFAGDVGVWQGNLSPYYFKPDPAVDFTAIATGIGDHAFDTVLRITAGPDRIAFEVVSLTGQATPDPLETYDLTYWRLRTLHIDPRPRLLAALVVLLLLLGMAVQRVVRLRRAG